MSYKIEVIDHLQLIVVKMTGEIPCAERSRALDEVLALIEERICARILVYFRNASSAIDTFQDSNAFARRLAGEVRLKPCRIAYLESDAPTLDTAVQVLAGARGFRPSYFKELAPALDWLLSTPVHRPLPEARLAEVA